MPICVYKKCYYIKSKESFNYSREELLQILTQQLENIINEKGDNCEILSTNIYENQNDLEISYELKYEKSIGVEENLIFNVSK